MHNTDVVPGTFELTLRDQEGNERGTTMVTLPPGGHRAQFLDELFGQDTLRNPAGSRNPQTHFRGGEFFTGTVVGIMTNVASLNDSSPLDEDSREIAITRPQAQASLPAVGPLPGCKQVEERGCSTLYP